MSLLRKFDPQLFCNGKNGGQPANQNSVMADGMGTFTSLPTELLMLVAKELDVRSLGRFASASAECQLAAYSELRVAVVVAVRQSFSAESFRLTWGRRAPRALLSDALVACPYFRLPDELAASYVKRARTARAPEASSDRGCDLGLKETPGAPAGSLAETVWFRLTQVAIPHGAFYHCKTLRKITLPARVTWIGISAFEGCTALHELSFPATLTAIGDFAFACCHAEGKAASFSARLCSTLPRPASANLPLGPMPLSLWPAIWVILLI